MGVVLLASSIIAFLFSLIKQPLIPAYILSGVLLGPVLGLVTDYKNISLLSEIGIAFLLFSVGLEVSFKKLKLTLGTAALIGVVKTSISFGLGYFIGLWLGFSSIQSVYFGLLLSFSSTMVLVKAFSDKKELETLHARIVVTILLIEDLFAVLSLALLSNLSALTQGFNLAPFLKNLSLISSMIIAALILSPLMFKHAARNHELLFVMGVSMALAFAAVFKVMGLSIAIGAFIAGLILGNLPYNLEILGRVKPLKDFFSVLFFASIGLSFSLQSLRSVLTPLIVVIVFSIAARPLILLTLMAISGFDKKVSFLTSSSMIQVSEFSIILAFQGLVLKHLNQEFISLIVLSAIITMSLTAYVLKFNKKIYKACLPVLKFLDKFNKKTKHFETPIYKHYPVVLIGYDRTGYSIFRTLKRMGKEVLVIDYNPDVIQRLLRQGVACIYGDGADPEILDRINIEAVETVISTMPDLEDSLFLIRHVRSKNKKAVLIVTASTIDDALQLYEAGADYVILPHFLGGEHASLILEETSSNIDSLIQRKLEHIRELHFRKHLHGR